MARECQVRPGLTQLPAPSEQEDRTDTMVGDFTLSTRHLGGRDGGRQSLGISPRGGADGTAASSSRRKTNPPDQTPGISTRDGWCEIWRGCPEPRARRAGWARKQAWLAGIRIRGCGPKVQLLGASRVAGSIMKPPRVRRKWRGEQEEDQMGGGRGDAWAALAVSTPVILVFVFFVQLTVLPRHACRCPPAPSFIVCGWVEGRHVPAVLGADLVRPGMSGWNPKNASWRNMETPVSSASVLGEYSGGLMAGCTLLQPRICSTPSRTSLAPALPGPGPRYLRAAGRRLRIPSG